MKKITKPPPVRSKPPTSREAQSERESGLNNNFILKSYNALTGAAWHDTGTSSTSSNAFSEIGSLPVGPIGFFSTLRQAMRAEREPSGTSSALNSPIDGDEHIKTFAPKFVQNSDMCKRCFDPESIYKKETFSPVDVRLLSGERGRGI